MAPFFFTVLGHFKVKFPRFTTSCNTKHSRVRDISYSTGQIPITFPAHIHPQTPTSHSSSTGKSKSKKSLIISVPAKTLMHNVRSVLRRFVLHMITLFT